MWRFIRFTVILVGLSGLFACSDRPQLITAPEVAAALPTRSVFVATSRQLDAGRFGPGRSPALQFMRYDLSVPPERSVGSIPVIDRQVDPDTQFLVKGRSGFADAANFRKALRAALRASSQREVIIYVHGFNNTFDEGVLRIAQLASDFDFQGVAVHYSWPSAGRVFNYAYDRDSVLYARDGLDTLINEVRAAGAATLVIVAHSVGSQLSMEVLRQRAIARPGSVARDISGVVLISPDIDIELFRSQALRIGKLPTPFGIFVSQRDRALRLSARLTGQRDRLGNADVKEVADLDVTLVNVTEFSEGAGHFTAGDSPALIKIFGNANGLASAFGGDSAGRTGLLSGTVLTVQKATEIILSPVTALTQ